MALVVADRVKETTTSTGTGTLSLAGAVAGFQSFAAGVGNTNTTYYAITDSGTGDWEVGIGTVTSGSPDTLSRDTVLESSNSDNLVNFGVGQKIVICTQPAEKSVYLNASDQLVINGAPVTATVTELNYVDGVTSNVQTQLDAKVAKSGDTMTGNLSFGDNNKAIFGTGGDLQIYHTGSNSYIAENGTGSLIILGYDTKMTATGAATYLENTNTGYGLGEYGVKIRHITSSSIASEKLKTTSTGIDVTGNITVSGTVDGVDIATGATNWDTAYGWGDHASAGYATQTYVDTAVSNLVDSAPATLDTLNELAAALGDDANFSTTVTNSLASKASLTGSETLTNKTLGATTAAGNFIPDTDSAYTLGNATHAWLEVFTDELSLNDSLTIGSQQFIAQGTNGFSVNEDYDPSNSATQTAYHFTSGSGRTELAFTLARTSSFTNGFGIYGDASDNKFVLFGEQNNTNWEWRTGVGIQPLDLDGGTLRLSLSNAGTLDLPNHNGSSTGLSLGGTLVTATAAELNLLDGVTATTAELNYVDGVTSNIQTQLNAKQDAATALTTSTTFGGDVSGTYNAIVVANDSHTHDTRYYTETEIGSFFGGTTAITGYNKTNWDTAYGWGNHASAGYLTGNQTITLTGDVSGSGTTSIAVTVANDSHTHDTRYFTETEADARFLGISAKAADSNLLDGIDSGSFLRSDANDTWSGDISTTSTNGIRFGNANQTDGNDGYIAAGKFGTGLNIVGTQTTAGTGRQVRIWGNVITNGGDTFWNSGNDGSGSGLDADLLDGQQGTYYQPASTALTTSTTFGGDVSGTYNAIVVADDSHNHIISNVDGLQTALDGKLNTSGGTVSGNLTIDAGNDTTVVIRSNDVGRSLLQLYGDAQGTGAVEVGQSGSYGGGMSYNGDGSPAWVSGETADNITFYRLDNGVRSEVFHYAYNSDTVNFNATPTVAGQSVFHDGYHPNADTLTTARTINGVSFNGSANITVTANTPNTLTRGSYLTGSNFNGSAATTWAVDATTTSTAGKIVARDASGDDYRRYGFAQYFNMSHAAATRSTDTVFYSSTDAYIRKNDATGFRASLNVPTRTGGDASGTWGISITGNAATATASSGDFTVGGNLYVPNVIYHTGDTNTYMQFHAADQWRVVTGGAERIEINNSYTLFNQNIVNSTQATTLSGTQTPNMSAYSNFVWTLSGNLTLANPTTEVAGMSGVFVFIHSGAARTVSLGTDYETVGGGGLTLSSVAGATDIVPYYVAASGRIILGTPQLGFV